MPALLIRRDRTKDTVDRDVSEPLVPAVRVMTLSSVRDRPARQSLAALLRRP